MTRELTCIRCPLGCQITVLLDGKTITKITGNTCKRGEEYAVSECTNPMRTVTSTVMTDKGTPVPVKTDRTIPKDKMTECMKAINNTVVKTPAKAGDIVFENLFGANLVLTADCE